MAATLIRNGTLIDGAGSPPIREAAVLIDAGRIAAAGQLADVQRHEQSGTAEQVDASGCWIIPGLIDAHVHATLTGAESMPVFLACGVTTVRDIGGPLNAMANIRAQLAGGLPGPRFIFAGPLIDGESPSFPNTALPIISSTHTPDAAADLAEECIAQGAGSVKLYFRLSREAIRAVIRRVGGRVPVTGHLGRTRASEAVADGINGLEHVSVTVYNDVVADAERFDAMRSSMADGAFWARLLAGWAGTDLSAGGAQRLLTTMRERDVTLDPTLDILRNGIGAPRAAGADANLRYVRPEIVAVWDQRRAAAPERPVADRDIARRGHEKCDEFVRRYHEMGGRVIAGTDVGAVPYLVPGFSLHAELRMLVDAGLSPLAALRAATLDAARALRIDSETGSIEPGKAADIVVLEGDPLSDIRNLGRLRTVFRAGVPYPPSGLLARVAPDVQ